ncbi:MAG: choice-of-anchor Q domain-containing protein, partial [Solirubrobacteraceae bacterium]
ASGGGIDRLLDITLEGGYPSELDGTLEESVRGAGILQIAGTVQLDRVRVTENRDGGYAGGIDVQSHGVLELDESELDNDVATGGGGGGVNLEPGSLIATDSSFVADNSLSGQGGALQLLKGSTAMLTNDTFAQNGYLHFGDTYEGGAVYMEGSTATLLNDTFSENVAAGNGHGGADISANEGSQVTMQNVLFGAGTGGEPEEDACNERYTPPISTWVDHGGNLAADTSCKLPAADMGVALGLGALSANGGPTMTVPLLDGSPAIDRGVSGCPAADQRGHARSGAACDSGSFEFSSPLTNTVTAPVGVSEETQKQTTTTPQPLGPSAEAVEHVLLGCGTSKLLLSDVYVHGRRVAIRGSAAKSLIGKRVRILLDGEREVAGAVVRPGGQFATSAPMPATHGPKLLDARYVAQIGKLRSPSLKLTRRLELDAPSVKGATVTLSGKLVPPFTKPLGQVVVREEVECGKPRAVKTFTPSRSGRYRITVSLPAGTRAALFRLSGTVAATKRTEKHPIVAISLPLPVAIGAGA